MAGEQLKAAAGILIYRFLGEFQYLLLQASYQNFHWSPPKGHVDPGEDKMQTALRETEEESGLGKDQYDIDTNYPPFVLKYMVKEKPKTVDYWIARLKNPQASIKLSDEHKDYKWVNMETALTLTHQDLGDAIKAVDKYLKEKEHFSS